MYITIISILVALLFGLTTSTVPLENMPLVEGMVVAIVGSFFLLISALVKSLIWPTLATIEAETIPRSQELFLKDRPIYAYRLYIFIFSLYCYFIVFTTTWGSNLAVVHYLIVFWIVLFGLACDALRLYIQRMMHYSHHIFLLDKVVHECLHAVATGRETEAYEWIDNIIEAATKSMRKGSFHTASYALEQALAIVEGYVPAFQRSLRSHPIATIETSLLDHVNSLCIYLAKRLQWVFEEALDEKMDPVAEDIISIYGKISLHFARYNPSLAHVPLQFIEKCAQYALVTNHDEIASRAAITLSELVKNYITLSKEKEESYRELVMITFSHLEEITDAIFKKNREINPALLMQPFAEVAELVGSEQYQAFLDREAILEALKRILTKFNALDIIMTITGPQ